MVGSDEPWMPWIGRALDEPWIDWTRLDLASPGFAGLSWPDPALVGPWPWPGLAMTGRAMALAVPR